MWCKWDSSSITVNVWSWCQGPRKWQLRRSFQTALLKSFGCWLVSSFYPLSGGGLALCLKALLWPATRHHRRSNEVFRLTFLRSPLSSLSLSITHLAVEDAMKVDVEKAEENSKCRILFAGRHRTVRSAVESSLLQSALLQYTALLWFTSKTGTGYQNHLKSLIQSTSQANKDMLVHTANMPRDMYIILFILFYFLHILGRDNKRSNPPQGGYDA